MFPFPHNCHRCDIDADKLQLCSSWWPGPVTCLFQANPGLPPQLTGKQGKIGVRIPDNRFLLEVMSSIPGPLVSTSANPTGEAASGCFSKLDPGIISGVDLWIRSTVDHESGNRNASTVVDLSGDSPEVVREGEGIELVRAAGV